MLAEHTLTGRFRLEGLGSKLSASGIHARLWRILDDIERGPPEAIDSMARMQYVSFCPSRDIKM